MLNNPLSLCWCRYLRFFLALNPHVFLPICCWRDKGLSQYLEPHSLPWFITWSSCSPRTFINLVMTWGIPDRWDNPKTLGRHQTWRAGQIPRFFFPHSNFGISQPRLSKPKGPVYLNPFSKSQIHPSLPHGPSIIPFIATGASQGHLPGVSSVYQLGRMVKGWNLEPPTLPYLFWILEYPGIPSGKLSHNYGKSPSSMGKSTINGHFQ